MGWCTVLLRMSKANVLLDVFHILLGESGWFGRVAKGCFGNGGIVSGSCRERGGLDAGGV